MTDPIDLAQDRELYDTEQLIAETRKKSKLEPGHAGECQECGEYFSRLIRNTCGRCRDLYQR